MTTMDFCSFLTQRSKKGSINELNQEVTKQAILPRTKRKYNLSL